MPVEMEHALEFIETLIGLSESLADAIERLEPLLIPKNDPGSVKVDLEALMTATLGCTNRARQFVAIAREHEDD